MGACDRDLLSSGTGELDGRVSLRQSRVLFCDLTSDTSAPAHLGLRRVRVCQRAVTFDTPKSQLILLPGDIFFIDLSPHAIQIARGRHGLA